MEQTLGYEDCTVISLIERTGDFVVIVFIGSVLVHLFLILRFSKKIRAEAGNHLQIVLRLGRREGIPGKVFLGSFLLIVCCFFWWIIAALVDHLLGA